MTVNGISVGSGSLSLTTGALISTGTLIPTNAVSALTGTVTVVITLSGASARSGTFRLDNFVLNGFVQALPGTATIASTSGSDRYRYGFNGKEYDNEVLGEGNEQDYGMRVYDVRVGKFLSVDPIGNSYPELTPYQFANNTPLEAIDLDGLEAKLAIAGKGLPLYDKDAPRGTTTGYKKEDAPAFEDRANRLKANGFSKVQVHTGKMLVEAFKTATRQQGSILAVVSFAHSGSNGIYLDNNAGFYTANIANTNGGYSNIDQMAGSVKSGDIKFAPGAIWIFAGCNAGNPDDPPRPNIDNLNMAEYAAKTLGITTIGARGYVSPEEKNGRETGRLTAISEEHGHVENPTFIMYIPVTVTTTGVRIVKERFLLFFHKEKEVPFTETKTFVMTRVLGNTINPKDYLPK